MEFKDYSWHDNAIHSFKIIEREDGEGDLELDIDYISEWVNNSNGSFSFNISPATLLFVGISELQIKIDYKSCSAGICPPSIHEINRKEYIYPNGFKSFEWEIPINWPSGSSIKFKAHSFLQKIRKPAVLHDEQSLPPGMRT